MALDLRRLREPGGSTGAPAPSAGEPPGAQRLLPAWLQVVALWALAVALPLFQLFSDSPEYLIAQDSRWPHLPLVSLLLVVVPPTAMVAVEALLRGRPRLADGVHRAFLGVLFAALVLQALKGEFDPARRSLQLVALLAGAAFVYLYGKGRFLPSLLGMLSPVAPAALVWFLVFSPVSEIAWPASGGPAVTRTALSTPVVLVVLDELSEASMADRGEINDKLPSFAALAGTSTWFRNATTVADNTLRAVPAILTGRLQPKADLPIAEQQPPSVFDRVQGRFHVNEPITDLCGDGCDDGSWVANGIELASSMVDLMEVRLRPGASPEFIGLPQEAIDQRSEDFAAFTDGLVDGLNVLHVELPHMPYQYGLEGKYTDAIALRGLTGEQWTRDPGAVREGELRYLAQLRFTDRLLGRLMADLRRKGLWDKALVIVTADHGVAFVPGKSRRDAAVETLGEIAGVPLFVKEPGQSEGRISDAAVNTIDILPTIGDVLGADWRLGGQSLRNPRSRATTSVSAQFGPVVKMPLAYYEALRDRASARLARAMAQPAPPVIRGG